MFSHTYLVQIVYQNKSSNGTNYQIVEAKNKKQAVEKTIKNLTDSICIVLSVKRVPKKIMGILKKHNDKVTEATNE